MSQFLTFPSFRPSRLLLLFLFGLLLIPNKAQATHVMGADLTYTCLGGNQYQFTLTMYRDCDGVAALPAYNIDISSASCGQNAVLTLTQNSVIDISPICPALLPNSSCNGGPLPGVQQYIYSAIYTFPAQCTDWVISWAECCRNNAITNANIISIANGTETYIEATLDNLTVSCNSSPTFTNIPTPYVCAGELFQYNHGAVDPDGDSLAYELVNPLETTLGLPTNVNYIPPFSATYPVSTIPANSFGFDPATGQLTFTPDVQQRGITAILVKEYRNGKLIGTTMRDIQIVVQNCTNSLPVWGNPTAVAGGTLNGQVFTVCAGNTLSFSIGASDVNAANVLALSSNLATSIPAATLNSVGSNPITAGFSWATSLTDVGIHSFTLTVNDGACPILGRQTVGFEVYVQGPVQVSASDQTVCPGTTETIELRAQTPGSPGNGTYTWTPATGLSDPTSSAPSATVSEAISYTVTFSEGVCSSTATVDIEAVGELVVTPDTSLCSPGQVPLSSNFVLNLPPPPAFCGISTNTCGGPATTSIVGISTQATGTLANAGGAGSPFFGAYQNARTQLLFRASELNAAGVTPGIISQISLNTSSLFSVGGYNGFTLRMGCTGATELTGFEAGLAQVFTGLYTPVLGANTIVLTTPYEWDGSSNLVLEFCFANAVASGFDHVTYTNTNYNSVFFGFSNTTAGCNLTTGFSATQRPNVSFTSCPLAVTPVYSWTPGTGLTSTTAPSPTASVTGSVNYVLTVSTPGCAFTDTASITLSAPPTLTPFANLPLCVGDSVTIVPAGTNLTGTFSWTPAAGLSNPNILSPTAAPGISTLYTLTVSNACGTATRSVNVNVLPAPQIVFLTATDVTCFGANDGTATVLLANPANVTYQWTPSAGITSTVSNLAPGPYAVTVTDAGGCSSSGSISIIEPPLLTLSLVSSNNPTCNAGTDGSITVLAGGGTAPFEYSSDGITYQPGATLAGLGAGVYNVLVRDANLCVASVQVALTEPLPIGGQVSVTSSDCLLPTGTFTISGEGGAGGYSYSIGGVMFQGSGTFTGLAAGQYNVTIQDLNGCLGTIVVSVSANNAPVGSLSGLANVLCSGAATGSASVSATGGLAPYQFSLDGVTFQPTGTFTNLSAGNYTVQITDANGCPGFFDFTIQEPTPVTGFISSQIDVTCPGGSDGGILILGNGGTPAYQYSINGVVFSPVSTFNNLAAGAYTITIRDANLCSTTVPFTMNEPTALGATVVALTPVSCFGGTNGAFTVSGTGGNGTFTYSINGVNFFPSGSFTNLTGGNYTVTVRDIGNCEGTVVVNVPEPTLLALTAVKTDVSCSGLSDGTATLTASGGTPPYNYSQNGITFSPATTFSGLAAGAYTFTVEDSRGCLATASITIVSPPAVLANVLSSQDASCFGANDGTITVAGGGGTPGYQYSLSGPPFQASGTFTGLAPANYTVTVSDINGCFTSVAVLIAEPAAVIGTVTNVSNVACVGAANGSITVAGSGGNGAPFTYSLNGINFQTSPTFSGLSAGTYTITVRDANNCEGTTTATVADPVALMLSLVQNTSVLCPGGNTGQLEVMGGGGTVVTPGIYQYAINGGAFQASPIFPGLTAGTYTITVRDDNLCTTALPFTVTEPQALGLSVLSSINVTCFGGSDGGVTLTGSGGTPGYLFSTDGVTFQANGTFAGLSAGPFALTIQDANGCTGTASVTINQPTQVQLQVTNLLNVACFGDSTGAISVIGTGGNPGYLYGIVGSPLVPINSYAGIPAGAYPIIVSDILGCADTQIVVVTQPGPIGLAIDSTQNVLCNNGASGAIYLSVAGGIGPFTYIANGGVGQNSPNITGLTAGPYQILVTDAGGCQDSVSTALTEPSALVLTPGAITNVTCPGGNDGAASVVASGGTPGYTYNWIPTGANTPAVTALTAGSFLVDVTDLNGCLATLPVNVTEPAPIVGNIQITQGISCFGLSDAAAVANASGGAGGYVYVWSAGTATGNSVVNLPAGTHYLTITDALGCVGLDSVTIIAPPGISLSISPTNISCFGLSDGAATANVSGGGGGFSFQWNNDPLLNTGTISGLVAGTYTVVITDANGCLGFDTVLLTQPPLISTVASGANETCTAANGELYAVASGGAGGFQYVWNSSPVQAGDSISGIPAGTYQVIVTDQNGCLDSATVTIIDETAPEIQVAQVVNVSCANGSNGGAQVTATGGTGIYTFSWNTLPIQTGATLSNVPAGSYTVTVDDGQCQTTETVVITQPLELMVSILNRVNPSCAAFSDGAITPVVTGGTPGYSFLWRSTPVQTDSIASNLPGGNYRVVVTDRNGCRDSISALLVAPEPLEMLLFGDSVNCFGETTGVAIATVIGGTRPYQYSWSGTTATGDTARNLGIGNYGLTVTDANGCVIGGEVAVGGPSELFVEVTGTDLICFEGNDGTALAVPSGGSGPYSFSWTSGDNVDNPRALAAGTWIVTVTDTRGCSVDGAITLDQPDPLVVTLGEFEGAFCDLPNGSATVIASGGTPGYAFVWNTTPAQNGPRATDLYGGTAGITPVVTLTDANGCVLADTVRIPNDAPAIADFTTVNLDPSQEILLSEADILFDNLSQFAVAYEWDFGDGAFSDDENPLHRFPQEGQYRVVLTAWDANFSCPDTASLLLRIIYDGSIFIPNAFSPNGDGSNDVFFFFGEGIREVEVSIFDRWGRKIAVLNGPADGWDGTMIGGGIAQEGVYVYKMEGRLNNGASLRRGGTITLVR
ncbi:MAG: gliding motility-associated C-terminal domain-containing protein [Bacteroidia bacterium]|nr:gliding motility-associated C-terminal domain-containing protein [Bacteroidia bacterium]